MICTMFVKNLEETPTTGGCIKFSGLKKEGDYYLPHFFKYVAWLIVLATVVSSSTVLILYGMSFGMVKTYLWLTAFLSSFMLSVFVTFPVKIFIFILINSICLKRRPVIMRRKINPCILCNPDNPFQRERILRFRQYNIRLYNPTPLPKLQTRLENIRYNLELRNLIAGIVFYFFFLVTGLYVVLITKTHMAFYSNQIIKENILNASYTKSIPFIHVSTYETFLLYLNKTLLPTLLNNPKDNSDGSINRKTRSSDNDTWGHTTRPPDVLRKRQALDDFQKTDGKKRVIKKGWTMNPNLKLMGKPRLRQIRVKSGFCKTYPYLKSRNLECADDLNLFNLETGNFTLEWEPGPPKGLTEAQAAPWIYRSAWESGTLPIFSEFSSYPGGGYILNLARNLDDARIILQYLDMFKWVDMKTRAVFVEFTLYCANTNLFTVVTLIFERPATGYFILSYRIHTRKFLFLASEFETVTFVMSGLFCAILFVYLLRESLKIQRTSLKLYIKRAFTVVDLSIMIFGFLNIAFIVLRSAYVSDLLEKLEKSSNNEFISFVYADVWSEWSIYVEALLVCCSSLKLFHLIKFRVVYFQLLNILSRCFRVFVDLVLKQFILYVAFALFFNLMLVNYSQFFMSFEKSLSTLFGQTVTVDTSFTLKIITGSSFLCCLVFALFILLISFLFVNIFIAVICMYFKTIRTVRFTDKYNVFDFIKYVLTKGKQDDILHLKEEKTHKEQPAKTNFVLRLRGGGNKLTKKKKKKKWEKKGENKEAQDVGEEKKLHLREFVTQKLYDSTMYQCLSSDHAVALRNLMVLFLTEDEKLREIYSQKSLRALFYCYSSDSMGTVCPEKEPGKCFFVEYKKKNKVYDVRVLERMKKVVEDWAKKKGFILEEKDAPELVGCENYLGVLEEKLSLLDKKLRSKYRESSPESAY